MIFYKFNDKLPFLSGFKKNSILPTIFEIVILSINIAVKLWNKYTSNLGLLKIHPDFLPMADTHFILEVIILISALRWQLQSFLLKANDKKNQPCPSFRTRLIQKKVEMAYSFTSFCIQTPWILLTFR